jgi:hypothetical protein
MHLGFALVLSWLAQEWHQKCHKLAPRGIDARQPGTQPVWLNISLASFSRAIHSLGTALLIDGEAANWGLKSAAFLSTRYHHPH